MEFRLRWARFYDKSDRRMEMLHAQFKRRFYQLCFSTCSRVLPVNFNEKKNFRWFEIDRVWWILGRFRGKLIEYSSNVLWNDDDWSFWRIGIGSIDQILLYSTSIQTYRIDNMQRSQSQIIFAKFTMSHLKIIISSSLKSSDRKIFLLVCIFPFVPLNIYSLCFNGWQRASTYVQMAVKIYALVSDVASRF